MSTEIISDNSQKSNLYRILKSEKLDTKDYLLGITLITYISGFLITNFYLGSLGVVHFDLLRVRYIITGFLYLTQVATLGE